MPTLVTRATQERLRPPVGFIAKKVKRCPVVIFCTIGTANFALVPWPSRLNLPRFNTGCQDTPPRDEVRRSIPTVAHVEILDRTALVLTLCDLPCLIPAAIWTWVVRPLKRLFDH